MPERAGTAVVRTLALIAAGVSIVVAPAACGGTSDADVYYSIDDTQDCLGAKRIRSYLFPTSEGRIEFDMGEWGEVLIAFGRDHQEIENLIRKMKEFAESEDHPTDFVSRIRVNGNVAYWAVGNVDRHFVKGVADRIAECLERSIRNSGN